MMARLKFSRAASFWLLATVLAFMLFAASAPSPLYVVYQARWHFSSLTLTAIFGVYVLALLAMLLITGRLSDHLGRRPVVLLALVVQIASMLAFIAARDVGMLFAARFLQGLGTGLATGALSAWLLDLQPPDHPGLGSLVVSVAPVAGLAAGTGQPQAVHAYSKFSQSPPTNADMISVQSSGTWRQVAAAGPGSAIYNDIVRWLPDSAGAAITATVAPQDSHLFSPWGQFTVFAVYTAILLIVGGLLFRKRDA